LDNRTDEELLKLEDHFATMSRKVTGEKLQRRKRSGKSKRHFFKKESA
ncbi:MAG: hypothetical protein QG623_533, partial [Patescibacteria group bacterium]|nr:hypothetical protein [Patescibacteria group bacterium]